MADVSKRIEKAEKYLQKGKQDSALEEYFAILQEDPNHRAAQQQAADLCIALNRGSEAVPLLSDLFNHQASVNDAAKANATYKKLARLTKPTVDQQFKHAQLTEKTAKKEAIEEYTHVIAEFTASGRKQDALAALKRLVILEPTLENFKQQGELAAELGDSAVAAEAFMQVGTLEEKAGGGAVGWFERAHSLDPANLKASMAYGRALVAKGDAAQAIFVLEPIAASAGTIPEFKEAYARALMAAKRPADAEPLVWELFEKNPKNVNEIAGLIGSLIDIENYDKAVSLSRKLEHLMEKAGNRREYVNMIKQIADAHPPGALYLEFLVELYNANNREGDYCETLNRLFELYYAAGNFLKAADSLDRSAEVDPYSEGHGKRLEMLKGKIDSNRFNAISGRIQSVMSEAAQNAQKEENAEEIAGGNEPTVLEDFMLQAEIYIQYGMRQKAVERLERVHKLFPGEELKNERLRNLYMNAGMQIKSEAPAPEPAPAAAPLAVPGSGKYAAVGNGAPAAPAPMDDGGVNNIARVTEITRNIYRQANVKSVLFTAVNDIGRHWNASRCVAGLCSPGKPPSAALEYCAPGVKQSDVNGIVKLIQTLQGLAVELGAVSFDNVLSANELAPIRPVLEGLGIQSVMAVPLVDGEEHAGILILEQCNAPRNWQPSDELVLKTIADQMVLAVNNAKLRSLMKTLAVTDEKSGLLKRSSYIDVLLSEVRRATQQNSTTTVMLLSFGKPTTLTKEIGEAAVESMMQQVGQTVCSNIRQNDVAVRYDLSTIALILPDTNDKNAFFVVDKMRKVLAAVKVPGTEKPVEVTVGIAEAVMQQKYESVDIVTELINRAEAALDAARAEGANQAKSLAAQATAAVA